MSFPAPAAAPESDAGGLTLPAKLSAPSPADEEISPPPAPATTLPVSLPSFPPLVAPSLPIVGGITPPPTSPVLSPPLLTPSLSPTSQPQPQPQPQPPLTSPPPITSNTPPPEETNPPDIIPPPLVQPIILTPPPQKETPPPNIISPPFSKPIDITPPPNSVSPPLSKPPNRPLSKPPPPTSDPTIPSSPPSPPTSSQRPKTKPAIEPGPFQPGSSRPETAPTLSRPPSPLPTSAVLPSPPPVALPVPQTPGGGAWIPFSAESPAPLPIFPSPPGTLSSPAIPLHGSGNGASSSTGDHQNIQADPLAPKGPSNGANGVVVGFAVGGVLLLLVAAVFGILLVICKRREKKKFDDYGSGRKPASVFAGFEEKSSLPQYTKQAPNTTEGLQTTINVNTPKGSSMASSGTPPAIMGLSPGSAPALSSGTFTYEELMRATNGFSEQNLLGQGGFGYVHKGVFPNGKEVAVKQLKMGGHQGEREFRAEVETISQVHHKHLVSLVGYCIAGAERLLIYEFVPNNTLEFHLHGEGQPVMDWDTRLKIAIGAAKGLAYLHEDCSPSIIHRDIKAANILLDLNCEAKVSDFGLAKIFSSSNPSVTHMTTRVVGTFGYLAPEYASSGKVTDKSDIYSYGVMLLELITGRPPISNFGSATCGSLVNWARPLLAQAIGNENFDSLADPRLQKNYDVIGMASMVACAAACVRLSAWRRPKMSQVVRALEGNLPTSELDDGMRPGQSSMHFPYESLDFDARNYMDDMKRMATTNNSGYTTTSRHSENTSEYGLHPSASSTDSSQPSRS